MWSVQTGREPLRLNEGAIDRAPAHAAIGIDVSRDGSRIATAGADGSVRIFDAETGKQLLALQHQHCVPHGLCVVNRAVFSPDGSMIATTGWDATIGIYDAHTGRRIVVLRGHKPGGLGTVVADWSRDGKRLLSTAHDGTRIWDPRTGQQLLVFPPGGGPGRSGTWSPDDRAVLTESGLGPLVYASTGKPKPLRLLETGAPVTELVFSPAGDELAIGTLDEVASTRIWDWPSGVEQLKLPNGGRGAAFSPDGKLLAAVQDRPTPFVHVWTLDAERLLEIARHRVTRSLTKDECRRYLHRGCSTRN